MAERDIDERRLAFGTVAELYDHARPSYPPAAIDELLEFGALLPRSRVLEVGAGTGKLTRLLAERGLAVVALEPSAAMAEVARRNCASYPLVEIAQSDFEHWQPSADALWVSAVVSAQAWHWVAPQVRCERAEAALGPGGALAAIWTLPDWERSELRDELREAYRRTVPELAPDFPMHPAGDPTELAGDWRGEIDASSGLSEPHVHIHRWTCLYSTAAYTQLLQTHQDHILLDPRQRARLLTAISRTIDQAGGTIALDYVTRLCLARRI